MPSSTEKRPLAVITGASSGIGAAFARALAARDHDLLIVARREDRLIELARECESNHDVRVHVQVADLSRRADIERLARLADTLNTVAVLVNNAGFGTSGRFVDVDPEKSADMVTVHVTATVLLTRAFLPQMIARNRGAIINLSTIVSDIAQAGTVVYCATKAFVNSFSRSLQLEMEEKNLDVKVRSVLPGLTASEFFRTDEFGGRGIGAEFERYTRPAEEVAEATLDSLANDEVLVLPDPINRRIYSLLVQEGKTWPQAVRQAHDELSSPLSATVPTGWLREAGTEVR